MGDDGYVNVPLPFVFPYYDQAFNNSWMYDNGAVSFLQPGTQGALSPWQWSSQPISSVTSSKYFIAPLWSDIAPTSGTSYTTVTDGSTYLKYNWTNISEYYSGGTRLNSFSLTIRPDGSFTSTYTGINLNSSNTSVGYVGDPAKGEYGQIYYSQAGTVINTDTIASWTASTAAPYPYQCDLNPLYSPSCPGYAQAYASSLVFNTPTEVVTVVEPVQTVEATPVTESTTSVVAQPVASAAVAASAPVSTSLTPIATSSGTRGAGVSLSTILNIVRNEQSRVSATETAAVNQANETAINLMNQVNLVSETVAAQAVQSSQSTATTQTNSNSSQQNTNSLEPVALVGPSPMRDQIDNATKGPELSTENNQSQDGRVKKNVKDNSAAAGVTIADIAKQPTGYELYQVTMKDAKFYPSKDIYKDKKAIDNERVLRQLNASSNRLYDEMTNQQYKEKQ